MTTTEPTRQRPVVPAGVTRANVWQIADPDYRIVATRDRHIGEATLWGDALQYEDGRIGEPTVRVMSYHENGLTPAQARQMGEELITVASEMELLAAANGSAG